MENLRRENAIVLTPELFEKLYLNPANNVRGDLRERYGNPTPLALLGFLLSLSPLSMELMGWRGAGGNGMATIGAYFFIGGFLMSLGGILEFFLGNTFSFVVFCSFGGFWFTLGATLTPAFNAYGAYSTDPNNPALGLESAGFHASFGTLFLPSRKSYIWKASPKTDNIAGFFLLFMGLLSLIFLICSLRTNLVFVSIFFGLMMLFAVLTGSYWNTAIGSVELAKQQQFVAGGFGIMATSAGWWIFLAQMLASVDFPIQLPVGDISHLITPWSAKVKAKEQFPA